MKKSVEVEVNEVTYRVEAECEGNCRYMVRAWIASSGAFIGRIGNILGKSPTWTVEPMGAPEGFPSKTFNEGCRRLLEVKLKKLA